MARTKAHRKYLLTFNNPADHGYSHEVIKTTLGTFSSCTYWCMCDEIGEQQTPHTHLFAAFKNPVEFTTMQQRFYGAHIDAVKGSFHENRDYVRKEGKWLNDAKRDTNLPETFEEWGELPPEHSKRESQSAEVFAMLQDGASTLEIIREYPTWIKNLRCLDAARQELLEEQFRDKFRELSVFYIWGKTGVGKTRSVMEQHGYDNVYRVTNYAHPFDNYRGQPVMLFDEFRSDLEIKDMLKYLDGYPLMLPCRFNDKVACYLTVYIVSNIPMDQQYRETQINEPETWQAFLRRFEKGGIYEMLPDSTDMPF